MIAWWLLWFVLLAVLVALRTSIARASGEMPSAASIRAYAQQHSRFALHPLAALSLVDRDFTSNGYFTAITIAHSCQITKFCWH